MLCSFLGEARPRDQGQLHPHPGRVRPGQPSAADVQTLERRRHRHRRPRAGVQPTEGEQRCKLLFGDLSYKTG